MLRLWDYGRRSLAEVLYPSGTHSGLIELLATNPVGNDGFINHLRYAVAASKKSVTVKCSLPRSVAQPPYAARSIRLDLLQLCHDDIVGCRGHFTR